MQLFVLEHSKFAYYADFVFYAMTSLALAVLLMIAGPQAQRLLISAYALIGLGSWTFIEYMLHRFVLHGLPPFSQWHAAHHSRPTALICAPTIFSASLIMALIFIPALLLVGFWLAVAFTFGVLVGYLTYAVVHHAIHHWHVDSAWLKRRKHCHALHHAAHGSSAKILSHYGVTSGFWDYVFGSNGG